MSLTKFVEKIKGLFTEKRDQRYKTNPTYVISVQSGNRKSSSYVWDLSINGVGILSEKSVRFGPDEKVSVTFPLNGGEQTVVRTGTVKTSKIYQPKPAVEPLLMLRCSIAFDEPLTQAEFEAISVESYVDYKAAQD